MTPIYDQLVAERGDPHQFAAHTPARWTPWTYTSPVIDLSRAPVTRAGGKRKGRKRGR